MSGLWKGFAADLGGRPAAERPDDLLRKVTLPLVVRFDIYQVPCALTSGNFLPLRWAPRGGLPRLPLPAAGLL